ncbi:MAG: orotate phosphoribosyltransferase [Opitutaceae bacterium]
MSLASTRLSEDPLQVIAGRRGHFQMESGYHSARWFDLDRLFMEPGRIAPHVAALAAGLAQHRVEAVCGAMTGGAKLAELIAARLGVPAFFAERFEPSQPAGFFPVRYEIPAGSRAALCGKSVAIVDDAISAGSAVRATYADVLACGAIPVAIGALFAFGENAKAFARSVGVPLETIVQLDFEMWPPVDCPLCRMRVNLEHVSENL